jgi:acetyl-CoA carboxylase alpha subunit
MGTRLRDALVAELDHLSALSPEVLLENRTQKFLRMGVFADAESGL